MINNETAVKKASVKEAFLFYFAGYLMIPAEY